MRIDKLDALLDSLTTDDEARSRFEQNPLGVLDEYGIDHDLTPADIPPDFRLPSKEDIKQAIDGHERPVIEEVQSRPHVHWLHIHGKPSSPRPDKPKPTSAD